MGLETPCWSPNENVILQMIAAGEIATQGNKEISMIRNNRVYNGLSLVVIMLIVMTATAWANGPVAPISDRYEFTAETISPLPMGDRAVGDPVDFDASMQAGANYLRKMQADVTEDNAGNGNPDVPDDPDDGGWDWSSTVFSHSTSASPDNIYGATALGLYYAYLESPDAAIFTAMKDAADFIAAAIPPATPRSGADLKFMLLFNDLYSSVVAPTTVYADVAKAKYDDRITVYGSATLLAEYIRDIRYGQGYGNGIIAWDVGIFSVVAQMLYDVYGGTYDADADAVAEVLWQDSFNDAPGYFDIVDDAGWDPTYADYNFYWYNLGVTGLIDAFAASGTHTGEISGLITLLLNSQFSDGGVSFCYGANTDDYDWQSTGYAMMTLGGYDQSTYQSEINRMGYWTGATQDAVSGGWIYGSGNHYPEVCGENTAGLYFTTNDISDVIVDDDFTSQTDVDVYNLANGTDFVWGYTAFDNIQAGIDAVTASTVYVAAGTYVETGQIVIDKNVTIIGDAGSYPVIMTDQNTSSSGDARGWFLVQPNYTVVVENMIFDGSGYLVYQGFRHKGNGSFTNCTFRHIKYNESTDYAGIAVAIFGDPGNPVDFTGCIFEDIGRVGVLYYGTGCIGSVYDGNSYTGKGTGDWLDYGVEFGSGAVGTVQNSTFTGCLGVASTDGSTSGAILATEFYGPGTAVDIIACQLTGNNEGVMVGYDVSDTSDVTVTDCIIVGNTSYGVSSTGVAVAAEGNWWGDPTGPLDNSDDTGSGGLYNPGGLGDEVSDNVDYDPWFGGNIVFTPDPQTISLVDDIGGAIYEDGVVCEYLGGGSGLLYGYSIDITWNASVITALIGDFVEPDNGPFNDPTLFIVQDMSGGAGGHVRIDAALPGTLLGIASGELFQATFRAAGTPDYATSDLTFIINNIRDNNNQPLSGFFGDNGLYIVDLVGPVVSAVGIVNDTLGHTDDFVKNTDGVTVTATVSDGGGMLLADIAADLSGFGAGAAVNPISYTGGLATWTLTGVTCTPADGTITVTVSADDGAGNSGNSSDTITADNTAPTAVVDFACAPLHNEIDCAWTDATGNDLNYYLTEIMAAAWGDYPDYGTAAPGYPGVGTPVYSNVAGTATTLVYAANGSERDIVYLQAYVADWALNYSASNTTAQGRATNYWLGDVSDEISGNYGVYDGYVTVADMTQLGTYYGSSPLPLVGEPVDVGPTDTASRTGIPTPDNNVDFEDLMIFSMNYAVVIPLPVHQDNATEQPQIAWRMVEENVWALELTQPCVDLKGINLQGNLSAGSVLNVQTGSLCTGQAGIVFLQNINANGLDAGLALMGTDLTFIGYGELLRVTFAEGVTPMGIDVMARSANNQPLTPDMETTGAPDAMPTVYRMAQNFPNPFNPTTMISFDLPELQDVKLAVFGPDGRKIVTLVSETLPAGFHSVAWNGRDAAGSRVASGVYFYRIEAGPLRQTSKMLMLK
jgi:hypothetical protein